MASATPLPPTISTFAPAPTRFSTRCAPAWAEVTTSAVVAGMASSRRCSATAAGDRAALLVTNPTLVPRSRSRAMPSAAPTTATGPR